MDMNKKLYRSSTNRIICGSDHCASDMGIDRLLRNRLDCLYYCSGHYAAEPG